jgi:hypothetical protein
MAPRLLLLALVAAVVAVPPASAAVVSIDLKVGGALSGIFFLVWEMLHCTLKIRVFELVSGLHINCL